MQKILSLQLTEYCFNGGADEAVFFKINILLQKINFYDSFNKNFQIFAELKFLKLRDKIFIVKILRKLNDCFEICKRGFCHCQTI